MKLKAYSSYKSALKDCTNGQYIHTYIKKKKPQNRRQIQRSQSCIVECEFHGTDKCHKLKTVKNAKKCSNFSGNRMAKL